MWMFQSFDVAAEFQEKVILLQSASASQYRGEGGTRQEVLTNDHVIAGVGPTDDWWRGSIRRDTGEVLSYSTSLLSPLVHLNWAVRHWVLWPGSPSPAWAVLGWEMSKVSKLSLM